MKILVVLMVVAVFSACTVGGSKTSLLVSPQTGATFSCPKVEVDSTCPGTDVPSLSLISSIVSLFMVANGRL